MPKASRKRRVRIAVGVCCLMLGLVTTAAIVAGSVYVFPFKRPSLRGIGSLSVPTGDFIGYPTAWPESSRTVGERMEAIVSPMTTEVATWGDHMQPWHMRLRTPLAARLIWFEKGRVYSKPGVGPAQASSAAVACWSFATDCWRVTANKTTGPLPLPAEITSLTQGTPRQAWAVAIEERGWPFRAATCRIIGTMDPKSIDSYVVENGVPVNPAAGLSGAIQEQPVVPFRPLWLGLIGNTLILGAAWYGLLLIPGFVIRAVRRGKNSCIKCGYDLRGQTIPGCPECGWDRTPEAPAA